MKPDWEDADTCVCGDAYGDHDWLNRACNIVGCVCLAFDRDRRTGTEPLPMWRCPDGGYCHHGCSRACFRVLTCGPLSGVWDEDKWPSWIAEAHHARRAVKDLVDEQAEDEGLWFIATTAPEAYLQQELRRLHAAVESENHHA